MNPRVLIIGYVWPEPTSSAAGVRSWNLIRAFQNESWSVSYASPSKENDFSEALKREGLAIHSVQANDPLFDPWIQEQAFDIVVFDRFVIEEQFGWRVQENSPQSLRVLDTQDLHFLRRARQAQIESGEALELHGEDLYRELASIYRCDLTLIISDYELDLLREKFSIPEDLLAYYTLGYAQAEPSHVSFEQRAGFGVIGNFRHPPNADGTLWLKKEIWPRIRAELPEATLHVYGAYPPKEMMNLSARKEGFIVEGPVTDARTTLESHRLNLAPLRYGAGVKGKIADGWRAGTPAISTPIGAEGMRAESLFGGEIGASPEEFAAHAVSLYRDRERWLRAQRLGYDVLERKFSESKNAALLIPRIRGALSTLAERRRKNHIGSMLGYHLLRSTKYFSKWIEAKNRV